VTVDEDPSQRDQRAFALRSDGQSFARVAAQLGMPRAVDAVAAFNRALRLLPVEQRQDHVDAELARLDRLAQKLKTASEPDGPETTRRLAVLEKLRKQVLAP